MFKMFMELFVQMMSVLFHNKLETKHFSGCEVLFYVAAVRYHCFSQLMKELWILSLHTLLVLQASGSDVRPRANLSVRIAAVRQKQLFCRKDRFFFTGRKSKCFPYRFQGPSGRETHSAHKWLCKTSAQARQRKTLKLLRWEGASLCDWNRVTCCSGTKTETQMPALPTDIFLFKGENRANMLRLHYRDSFFF